MEPINFSNSLNKISVHQRRDTVHEDTGEIEGGIKDLSKNLHPVNIHPTMPRLTRSDLPISGIMNRPRWDIRRWTKKKY